MATRLQFIKSASGSDVSTLSITDCFSSQYQNYELHIVEYINSDLSDFFAMRFIDSGGSIISDTEYAYANLNMRMYTSFSQNKSASTSEINNVGYSQSDSKNSTSNIMNIFNPFDNSAFTYVTWKGVIWVQGFGGGGMKAIGIHESAEQLSGVSFHAGNSINSIKVNVYGIL
jgi:hypothetical protein